MSLRQARNSESPFKEDCTALKLHLPRQSTEVKPFSPNFKVKMFLIIFFREALALLIICAMKYTKKYIALN